MTKLDVAVVGTEDFTLGFRLAGIRRVHTVEEREIADRIEEILKAPQGIGILVLNAKEVENVPPGLKRRISDSIDPVVVRIGGSTGDLREKVKRAIGVDLYKN